MLIYVWHAFQAYRPLGKVRDKEIAFWINVYTSGS